MDKKQKANGKRQTAKEKGQRAHNEQRKMQSEKQKAEGGEQMATDFAALQQEVEELRRQLAQQEAGGKPLGPQANNNFEGPCRLVVRTSRCGRDNPGSNPGLDIFC